MNNKTLTVNRKKQTKLHSNQNRRSLANSEFIREKLELDYSPVYRIFKTENSSLEQPFPRKQSELQKRIAEKKIFQQTKSQIAKGKSIIIDWSVKSNYRSAKFPDILKNKSLTIESAVSKASDHRYSNRNKNINNSVHIYHHSIDRHLTPKQKSYLDDHNIIVKSEYLKGLLTPQVQKMSRRKVKSKQSWMMRTEDKKKSETAAASIQIFTNENIKEKLGMKQKINQKQRLFFESNRQSLKLAMRSQDQILNEPITLKHTEINTEIKKIKKPLKQLIGQRILKKSKLTLIKSDLIRKFKKIRENILEEEQNKQNLDYEQQY